MSVAEREANSNQPIFSERKRSIWSGESKRGIWSRVSKYLNTLAIIKPYY